MRVGIAADHGGFEYKQQLIPVLRELGHEVKDYGADALDPADDYPDYAGAVAGAVAAGEVERGIAICGSGVGACVAANKIPGVRAALVHDAFSAHQGVEDDDMNIICLGARVIGIELAKDVVKTFLGARFSGAERHQRRLSKVIALDRRRGGC